MKKRNESKYKNDVGGRADVRIGQFSFVQSHEGVKSWELKADRAEIFEKEQRAILEKVAVTLQMSQGDLIDLEGDSGSIDTAKKNFYLKKKEGPMAVRLSNGYTVEARALSWFDDQKLIVAEGPAHVSGPRIEIDGTELRVATENQEVTIVGHVHALVY